MLTELAPPHPAKVSNVVTASAHTQDFNRWPLANLALLFFDLRLDFTNSNRIKDPNYGFVIWLRRAPQTSGGDCAALS